MKVIPYEIKNTLLHQNFNIIELKRPQGHKTLKMKVYDEIVSGL